MVDQERRAFPRIHDEGLSLKLGTGDFDIITHTLNVSASGIYCKIDKEIPLMSRVSLKLMLPDVSKDDKTAVQVSGVVVREHPVIIDGATKHYDVAIFFEDLSPKNRETILSYISKRNNKE